MELYRDLLSYSFDQYNDITKYRFAINDVIARLESLQGTVIKEWHSIIYFIDASKAFPKWA